MPKIVGLSLHRVALLVALTLALVATGFSHRVPQPTDAALAFALANDVPLSDLCGGEDDDGSHRHEPCLACHIAGTGDLPAAASGWNDLELAVPGHRTFPGESRVAARVIDHAHPPQGPPVA